jgi:hypothetical protein
MKSRWLLAGAVCFGLGGNLFAIRAIDGQMMWSHQMSECDHVSGASARVSQAVAVVRPHGDPLHFHSSTISWLSCAAPNSQLFQLRSF